MAAKRTSFPHRGAAFGFEIRSNVPLPFVAPAARKTEPLYWLVHPARNAFSKLLDVHAWKNAAGKVALRSGYDKTGAHWLEIPKLGRFHVEAATATIHGYPLKGTPPLEMTQQFLTQILPLCFSSLGLLVLHASVLKINSKAWLFVGASGQGKSALAAALAQHGASLLSDDTAVLEVSGARWTVRPGFPALRLHSATLENLSMGDASKSAAFENGKCWVGVPPLPVKPVPVAGICFLETAARTAWTIRSASDAFPRLLTQTSRLNTGADAALTREFQQVTELLKQVPSFTLSYPRDWKTLPEVCTLVLKKIKLDG